MSSDPDTLPFRVVVEPAHPAEGVREETVTDDAETGWSLDDIEAAYQQALESLDTLDEAVSGALGEPVEEVSVDDAVSLPEIEQTTSVESFFPSSPVVAPPLAVSPRQVVEALLFVGGISLPGRKIAEVVSGSTTTDDVAQWIDELNDLYDQQARPYCIEMGDGGYVMRLRNEYEKVRHRVFGVGPREVKLSQDVLEVLSFIAYSQPVTEDELDGLGRAGVSSVVRQLIRRELIQVERGSKNELQYITTPRFLELFGLRSRHDLPLPGDFSFK